MFYLLNMNYVNTFFLSLQRYSFNVFNVLFE